MPWSATPRSRNAGRVLALDRRPVAPELRELLVVG